MSSISVLIFLSFLSLLVICRFLLLFWWKNWQQNRTGLPWWNKFCRIWQQFQATLSQLANVTMFNWTGHSFTFHRLKPLTPLPPPPPPSPSPSSPQPHHCGLITIYFCFVVSSLPPPPRPFFPSLAVVSLDFYWQFSNKANSIDSLESGSEWKMCRCCYRQQCTSKNLHKTLICQSVCLYTY